MFKRVPISKQRTFTISTPYKTTDKISYALEVGPKLIDILENYFGVDLPVGNIDVYPVPSVFPYLSSKLGIIIAQYIIFSYPPNTLKNHDKFS